MKPLKFIDTARDDLSAFPRMAKREAGNELWYVQIGATPSDRKPMSAVGPGAFEIRIHVEGEWRVVYVAKFDDAVFVLHAFRKKTRKTSQRDLDLARKRYREIPK